MDEKRISPNEMIRLAKQDVLNGRDPVTRQDWVTTVNYLAFRIHPSVAHQTLRMLKIIYRIPLEDDEIKVICGYQIISKTVYQIMEILAEEKPELDSWHDPVKVRWN